MAARGDGGAAAAAALELAAARPLLADAPAARRPPAARRRCALAAACAAALLLCAGGALAYVLVSVEARAAGARAAPAGSVGAWTNDFELTVRATKGLEHALEARFGAPDDKATGLQGKISAARTPAGRPLPDALTRRMRYLATVRNQLVHEPGVDALPDRGAFVQACDAVNAELERLARGDEADDDDDDDDDDSSGGGGGWAAGEGSPGRVAPAGRASRAAAAQHPLGPGPRR